VIADDFPSRTLANMEIALEQACKLLPVGAEQHKYRRFIASRLIGCAKAGRTTLGALAEAGHRAASELRERDMRAKKRGPMRKPMPPSAPAAKRKTATRATAISAEEKPARSAI
jgi:hypothetical protein